MRVVLCMESKRRRRWRRRRRTERFVIPTRGSYARRTSRFGRGAHHVVLYAPFPNVLICIG